MMKQKVKINAPGVSSKYGYIVEDCGEYAIIKVGCSVDHLEWLEEDHCIILGCSYYEKI